jgi:hypothetical protein
VPMRAVEAFFTTGNSASNHDKRPELGAWLARSQHVRRGSERRMRRKTPANAATVRSCRGSPFADAGTVRRKCRRRMVDLSHEWEGCAQIAQETAGSSSA